MTHLVVEAHAISRWYGRGAGAVRAVASASLAVRAGEIVGIYGPSGSGKSTLLRLLGGIEPPTAGTLLLGGQPARARRYTGFVMPVFQDPAGSLDPRWPVWQTITEPLTAPHRAERPSRLERREIARRALDSAGLADVNLDARPASLSGGQCQRVSVLRAVTARPALLLADEPTSALDASVAAGILQLLHTTALTGTALVVVSHDVAMLQALCSRVLSMARGVLAVDQTEDSAAFASSAYLGVRRKWPMLGPWLRS